MSIILKKSQHLDRFGGGGGNLSGQPDRFFSFIFDPFPFTENVWFKTYYSGEGCMSCGHGQESVDRKIILEEFTLQVRVHLTPSA